MPAQPCTVCRPPRRVALAVAVALALVLAQWLGVLHRVVHDGVRAGEHRLGTLFQDHGADGPVCHLIDQLTHADALGTLPCASPVVPLRIAALPVHASWQLAAQAAGSLARGPPLQA